MKRSLMGMGLVLLGMSICCELALAQAVRERVEQIKIWRQQCNEPDIDLRMAYVEEAIKSDDKILQRICLRQSLESDNADIRNLGLRAAMASLSQITFKVEMPQQLKEEYEKAGKDEKKLSKVSKIPLNGLYQHIRSGLSFVIKDAVGSKGTSTWHSLVGLTKPDDVHKGETTIIGENLTWTGSVAHPNPSYHVPCKLNAHITAGAILKGEFQCYDWRSIPIEANLL